MADPIWGMLAKSQVDPEKIEEAIIRLILAHNNDETSHLEVGQSLQSHKASEIIDHLAESIVEDKFATGSVSSRAITTDQLVGKDIRTDLNVGATQDGVKLNADGIEMWQSGDKKVAIPKSGDAFFRGDVSVKRLNFLRYNWFLPFESVDAYNKSIIGDGDEITPQIQALLLRQSSTDNAVTGLWVGEVYSVVPNTAKNPSIEFSYRGSDGWAHDSYVVWGSNDPFGDLNLKYFGFKIKSTADHKIYACYRTSSTNEVTTELTGINPDVAHHYRAEVINGGASIKYYVDGVLLVTASPSSFSFTSDYLFSIYTKAKTEGEGPPQNFWSMTIQQDF